MICNCDNIPSSTLNSLQQLLDIMFLTVGQEATFHHNRLWFMLGRRLVTTGNGHEAIQGQTRHALLSAKCAKCSRLFHYVLAPVQLYIQFQIRVFHKRCSSSRISICGGVAREEGHCYASPWWQSPRGGKVNI